ANQRERRRQYVVELVARVVGLRAVSAVGQHHGVSHGGSRPERARCGFGTGNRRRQRWSYRHRDRRRRSTTAAEVSNRNGVAPRSGGHIALISRTADGIAVEIPLVAAGT